MQAQGVDRTQLEMFLPQLLTTSPKSPRFLRSACGRGHVRAPCIAKSARASRAPLTAKSALRDAPVPYSALKKQHLPGEECQHHPGPCSIWHPATSEGPTALARSLEGSDRAQHSEHRVHWAGGAQAHLLAAGPVALDGDSHGVCPVPENWGSHRELVKSCSDLGTGSGNGDRKETKPR